MINETVLIDTLDGHGRVSRRERIALRDGDRSFTLGRAVLADVTLDDAHLAPLHLSITIASDGQLMASDLGSLNGFTVAGQHYLGVQNQALPDGVVQIGRSRLRIRTAHEQLEPEKPDRPRPSSFIRDPAWLAGIGAAAVAAQLVYSVWLSAPRDLITGLLSVLVFGLSACAIWVLVWALLSRVLRAEWRWLHHAAILLGVAALFFAIEGLTDLGWFVFSLPDWSTRAAWIGSAAVGVALYLHLIHASNTSSRRAALAACLVPALLGGASQWLQQRGQSRDVNYIGGNLRIYPPALRLRAAGDSQAFFENAAKLRDAADKKRKATRADEDDSEMSLAD